MTGEQSKVRLDRLLANMGYGSRKDIQAFVKHGRITLDGKLVVSADMHVVAAQDLTKRLRIAGEFIDPPPGVILLMNKPLGVTCSHKEAGPLVYDLLPLRWRARKPAISSVGRLDKETSGLLLMTDDGGLLHKIIAPKSNVTKRYRVHLARPLNGNEASILASGTLMLDGETKPLLPVIMTIDGSETASAPIVEVTLSEGRYHQVRRMFAAMGNHVTALHRTAIGTLQISPDLAPGHYRPLDDDDVRAIFM